MPDFYHAPALILTALLLPAFGYLYIRSRNARTLFWFLGFLFALLFMAILYPSGGTGFVAGSHPWISVAGQTSIQISVAMFLGSLSPLCFRIGRFQVLFVVPYILLLVAYSILLYGVFGGVTPRGPALFLFPLLAALCFTVGIFWGTTKGSVPEWIGVSFSAILGCVAVCVCFFQGAQRGLIFIECVNLLMTTVLLLFVFRRFSPGVFLSVLGFVAWSLYYSLSFPWVHQQAALALDLNRVVAMAKVVAAMGMILITLEDELNSNKLAEGRERQARRQLEAYANIILTRRRVEDFDRQGADVCETIVAQSRFSQAALLLESGGRLRLAGSAGLDPAIVKALGALLERIALAGFLEPGSAPAAAEGSRTLAIDLSPWFVPGDDLERLRFTSVLAVPMIGRNGAEGALLLRGLRAVGRRASAVEVPRADDLLPIELLAARLQATRSQTMLFEKLIDSEKYAGIGQLAGNVTQQLNNPLTVILGYASLLEESASLDAQDRKAVTSIMTESRRIRATLESLARVSLTRGDLATAVAVPELLADMEQLYRSEFLHRSIEFQVNVAAGLPRIRCGAQQLRQAVLHCLQFAIDAVERDRDLASGGDPKTVRVDAGREGDRVQISISHSGPGFQQPERAFDPFVPLQSGEETAGLRLSLCASILRDQNGCAHAKNLEPSGAAIILELQSA
jgi:signal transduction histidine kinase